MSNYLIELCVIHVVLTLAYWLLLRKERQYAQMRFYLIATTLLALFTPLLKLPKLFFNYAEPVEALPLQPLPTGAVNITSVKEVPFWQDEMLIWIYVTISAVFLFKLISSLVHIIHLAHKGTHEKVGDISIRKVRQTKGSFTFFNWIFLNDQIDKEQEDYHVILNHEKAHVSLGHTYDLMFFELFKVCFWWLPSAWFINKEIRKIHEYQADACALKSYSIELYSSILIRSTLKSNGLSLASSFHDGLILKRITAMKQKVKIVSPWKMGTLSACCAILFTVFACTEEIKQESIETAELGDTAEQEVFTIVEEQPGFSGGMDGFYNYVKREIKYPAQARRLGIEGEVVVEFVVEKDGSLSDVKAVKGIGAGCDGEAVRVIENAPAFSPGKQRGKPVRVRMVMPINFKLDRGSKNGDNTAYGIIMLDEVKTKHSNFKVDASYNDGNWSGTVYDENGDALPGVNIVVGGTNNGTVSDWDGTFKLEAASSQDIYLSSVGYETALLKGQ
ncbi:MAG: TonB family protein [Bacteroidota bacterium]